MISPATTKPGLRGGNRVISICLFVLAVFALVALVLPPLIASTYFETDLGNRFLTPALSGNHFFGTDDLGRDMFARTLLGIRVTLFIAVIASVVSLLIGVIYGAVAGFVGGKTDALMMRFVDAFYAMPFIFLVILLMTIFERSLLLIFVTIGLVNWLDMARIVRGQTISLKQSAFVEAARITGVSTLRIIWRHITPNLLGIVIVYMTLAIPQAILVESFLSFLGLGVQEPQTSLGSLVNAGVNHLERAPWLMIIPATVLALILVCLNFLGDGLRDLVDPRSQKAGAGKR